MCEPCICICDGCYSNPLKDPTQRVVLFRCFQTAAVLFPASAMVASTSREPPALRALLGVASSFPPHPHINKLATSLRALLWAGTATQVLSQTCNLGDLGLVIAAGRRVPVPDTAAAMRYAVTLYRRGTEWRASCSDLLAMCGPVPLQVSTHLCTISDQTARPVVIHSNTLPCSLTTNFLRHHDACL